MKSSMRYAEKLGPACILFEGEDERAKGEVQIRAMIDGEQKAYPFEAVSYTHLDVYKRQALHPSTLRTEFTLV